MVVRFAGQPVTILRLKSISHVNAPITRNAAVNGTTVDVSEAPSVWGPPAAKVQRRITVVACSKMLTSGGIARVVRYDLEG